MTPDDIIRMARKAGYTGLNDPWLHTFAAFVAARTVSSIDPSQFMSYREGFEAGAIAEREACAKRRGVLMFNPYTGTPRHPSDIASDPHGILLLDPEQPLRAARGPQ